ncbi:MAG TPA: HAMP domain-containing histidine kinase [Nitrospirae bacterium]|nr:HAMP domain-containing histidine kinase [Nitrospirota bacterium]
MKLKIWHKMIVGISIPSLIAVLGAILTYGYVNDVKEKQSFVQFADDMKENVLEIRRNEKNFLHYRNIDQIETIKNAITSFLDLTGKVSLETANQVGIEEINPLKESIQRYSELVNELGKNFQKEIKITGRVRKEGEKLENIVLSNKLAKEISTSFVLRLRLLETNYMLLHNDKSQLELSKTLSQISNVTPFCYDCSPYINSIHDLITVYRHSDNLAKSLQDNGDSIEEVTKTISDREREQISAYISMTQRRLLIGLFLLCILGPLFVYKTASYIAAPIKRLAEIARKIADGDINLRAPLKEHDETFSLAVSFNTMLDNLQQTQQSLNESLELVKEKQAQLVESEKRASMGFLVSGIAHELNNPLNNISLRAEIVSEEIKAFPNERIKNYVKDIVNQSKRAHKIINNLLDFARTRKSSDMEKQDIVRITEDSLNLVTNQFAINNIKIIKHLPDIPFNVYGNRSKLEQILVSIINNAFQAMAGTGTLTVTVEPTDESKFIHIRIGDTGKGIPEANIKNVFEPFFTTKTPGDGTGLGLAISKTLVKEHKGEIHVESTVGEGTTFHITLPAFEETDRQEEINT